MTQNHEDWVRRREDFKIEHEKLEALKEIQSFQDQSLTWYPQGGDSQWINPVGEDIKEKDDKARLEQNDRSQHINFEEKINLNDFGSLVQETELK